ncbi:MAG: sialidase family protein [Verrucomicrobiota bacterium]
MFPRHTLLRTARSLLAAGLGWFLATAIAQAAESLRKVEDVVIYADALFHNAFPSIVRRPDGELLVAFRRAPDRRRLGDEKYTHADPNSHLVLVRSKDSGKTWSKEPQLIFAHPFGGSQDPCMVALRDDSILCSSYAWSWMPPEALPKLPQPNTVHGGRFAFLGGFLLKSNDGGRSWDAPIFPAPCPTDPRVDIFGKPLPVYNRGAMCEGSDGRLYWPVAASAPDKPARTEVHLMISADKGATWTYSAPIARDPKATFNETSMYETPKGDLIAFLRTAGLGDKLCVARSKDRGRTFQKWEAVGFQGHPFHALRLPDGRALLVYGYRHPPYGIRARVLDPECTDIAGAREVILRDDGGGVDLGYPWSTMIAKDRALVVYYFNQADGARTIEGTIVQLN